MKKTDLVTDKKYRILEYLKKLPHEEYKIAKKKLPLALEVSTRTFERWLYLTIDSKMEVSADKLAIISHFFELDSIDELINYKIKQFNIKKLKAMKDLDINLIKDFDLIK
ncbi:hypothetical protein ACSTS3_10400 [Aquimarina muelleri]|uniref:hypothetical protein n=1 Tax=Aquimarina muelleri TaxID=279356 RepID=UPI003F688621